MTMIHSLKFAMELHDRCRTREMLVSGGVFHEVLALTRKDSRWCRVLLNRHYDSPKYRFIHQVEWGGIRFIHLSDDVLEAEYCPVAPVTEVGS